MHVVVAPDSFGGTLSAAQAAAAIIAGWTSVRPADQCVAVPMSDGGEGFLDVVVPGVDDAVANPDVDTDTDADRVMEVEVAGPRGHPVHARWVLRGEVALVEAARANGLALLEVDERDPLLATSHGVGALVAAARAAGARRIVVGLGGSATVDGGAGALTALGFALRMADGSGLKVGGGELQRLDAIAPTWVQPGWDEVEVDLLADVGITLGDAAEVFGPQKGADAQAVEVLARGLSTFATVVERDLDVAGLSDQAGTGAAGGLGYGLAAGIGGQVRAGAPVVAGMVGLDDALRSADLVITGEGRVDATTATGKVVAEVRSRADTFAVEVAIVAGSGRLPDGIPGELSAPNGPDDAAGEVRQAAARLANRWTDVDADTGPGSDRDSGRREGSR